MDFRVPTWYKIKVCGCSRSYIDRIPQGAAPFCSSCGVKIKYEDPKLEGICVKLERDEPSGGLHVISLDQLKELISKLFGNNPER